MDNLSTKTSNMTIAFKELQNSVFEGGLGEMLKSLADRLGQLALRAAAFVRLVTSTQSIADVTGVGPGDPVGQNNALTRLIEEEQAVLDNLASANDRTAAKHGHAAKTAGSQERLDMLKRMQAETQIQIDLLKDLENQENSTAVASSELSEAFGELDTVVKEAGQNLSRDFANALLEGESALESFINLAVVQPIISSIFAGFGGSGVSPDFVGPPKPPGLAGGGMASQGRPVLVGERGPELFVPHAPGNIINSANTRSALSGGGVVINQNISFATGVVPTVRAEVTKMLPQIADVSKAAVLDASLRGGSFAKGLRGRSG